MTSLPPQTPGDDAPRTPESEGGAPLTRREAREQFARRQAAAAAGSAPTPPEASRGAADPKDTAGTDADGTDGIGDFGGDGLGGRWPDELRLEAPTSPQPQTPRAAARSADAPATTPSLAWQPDAAASTPPPRPPRTRRRWLRALITTVVIVGLVASGGAFAFHVFQPQVQAVIDHFQPHDYEGDGTGTVDVTIAQGDGGSNVATTLEKAGVVKDGNTFYRLLLTTQPAPVFQPGVYRLHKQMSAKSALALLQDPSSKVQHTLAIPEGETEKSVLAAAAKATGLPLAQLTAAASDPAKFGLPSQAKTLEGFLFPATYQFDPGVTADDVVKTLVTRAKQAFSDAGIPDAKVWDTVVLASVVQAEAGPNPDDLGKIARVFDNRLAQGMPLQSDATVHYGLGTHDTVWTTDAQRNDASNPYNTYAHTGLPIGPIGNPGEAALKAALHPTPGAWLYFVTVNLKTGKTVFSETQGAHDQAVAQLQGWCAASAANEKYCG